ncbi:ATP-grasp domain-containing protein [Methylobacterium tarhaniae]|uniref:ATP-grasp domain-containing protein n=1 Tax=Methylobacterium tarhaniae TaxID=1187852 RepID=UPI003CFC7E9E
MADAVAVTIFGHHTEGWMRALAPASPVWSRVPNVRSVRVLHPQRDFGRLMPESTGGAPVLIPLLVPHIRDRPRGYVTACPSLKALAVLGDKGRFSRFATRHGLAEACPVTYDTIEAAKFPVIAKPVGGASGCGIALLRNMKQYELFIKTYIWKQNKYILQEFIDRPDDYCLYMFCSRGKIVWHQAFRYTLTSDWRIRGMVTAMGEVCTIGSQQIAQIAKFMEILNYTGPCNADFKVLPDGSIRILEFNPRLGGTLMVPEGMDFLAENLRLAIAHGVMEPRLSIRRNAPPADKNRLTLD